MISMISMISCVYFTCILQAPRGRGGSELRQEMTRADFALTRLGLKNVWPMRQTLKGHGVNGEHLKMRRDERKLAR